MPWVEEEIEHSKFLDTFWWKILRRFKDPEENYWWQNFNEDIDKVEIYKISFERGLLVNRGGRLQPPSTARNGNICVTRHIIMRRWDNEFLGLAQSTGAIRVSSRELPVNQDEWLRWSINFYNNTAAYTTVYAYTMDNYEGYTHFLDEANNPRPVTILSHDSGKGVLLASLDIEHYNENLQFPKMMQSPIVTLRLNEEEGELSTIGGKMIRTNTNWWDDSIIRVKGNITERSMFLTFQTDSAPTWQNNLVTTVPLFFGNIIHSENNSSMIGMFGGTQVPSHFDYDNLQESTSIMQPINRNYVHYPSNGIDSIMVKRSKYGARYQSHFLRWNAPANEMPPTRSETRGDRVNRKYPRSWNYLREGYYQYDFHPSRYSDTLHSSRAYVVHPEDGVLGYIPAIILTPSINMSEGETLQLPHYCIDCQEEYIHPVPEEPVITPWEPPPDSRILSLS
ncbi:hypothetical protein [Bacillus horti]|uniref:Uncharacterized protein n=1 Tax=Caldalkalibacillus horti TaxID=77523 RepID=A0ABT9W063_9BACI|nr:hypothetical protein [Bacillus horti]MDQ0166616.1 hypothetical protein [Bacillus horti]